MGLAALRACSLATTDSAVFEQARCIGAPRVRNALAYRIDFDGGEVSEQYRRLTRLISLIERQSQGFQSPQARLIGRDALGQFACRRVVQRRR